SGAEKIGADQASRSGGTMRVFSYRFTQASRSKYRNFRSSQAIAGSFVNFGMPIIVPPHVLVRLPPGVHAGSGIARHLPASSGAFCFTRPTYQSGARTAQ